jgi:hypothetical protein
MTTRLPCKNGPTTVEILEQDPLDGWIESRVYIYIEGENRWRNIWLGLSTTVDLIFAAAHSLASVLVED